MPIVNIRMLIQILLAVSYNCCESVVKTIFCTTGLFKPGKFLYQFKIVVNCYQFSAFFVLIVRHPILHHIDCSK